MAKVFNQVRKVRSGTQVCSNSQRILTQVHTNEGIPFVVHRFTVVHITFGYEDKMCVVHTHTSCTKGNNYLEKNKFLCIMVLFFIKTSFVFVLFSQFLILVRVRCDPTLKRPNELFKSNFTVTIPIQLFPTIFRQH